MVRVKPLDPLLSSFVTKMSTPPFDECRSVPTVGSKSTLLPLKEPVIRRLPAPSTLTPWPPS